MILVDTSIWVDHFRRGDAQLATVLDRGEVQMHPFIIGELACGHLQNRREILALISALPEALVATHEETMGFIHAHRLRGRGIGWIDAHLLASAKLSGALLWTRDRHSHGWRTWSGSTPRVDWPVVTASLGARRP